MAGLYADFDGILMGLLLRPSPATQAAFVLPAAGAAANRGELLTRSSALGSSLRILVPPGEMMRSWLLDVVPTERHSMGL